MSKTVYESLNAAARGLLGEASAIAISCGKEFAICGGWSPVLRNSTVVSHPGTRDVDLLFSEGAKKESLKNVVSVFLKSGYLVSAKHEFQILRTLNVRGTNFVFNVDLLHPHEGEVTGGLCVDHLSLPIPHEDFKSTYVFMKSIALPNAGFVFDGFIAEESIEFLMPDGTTLKQKVPIIDEVGVIATKSKSCLTQKRPRDIFDIYLAISSPRDKNVFSNQIRRLRERHEGVFATLECIHEGVKKWESKFGAPAVFAERGVNFKGAADDICRFIEGLGFGKSSSAREILEKLKPNMN
jgi:hypothetical protein